MTAKETISLILLVIMFVDFALAIIFGSILMIYMGLLFALLGALSLYA